MTKQRSKASLLGIVIFLWGATLFAWPPDTLWTKTYGGPDYDEGYSVCETSDGSYIVAGYTKSFGAGEPDVWLIKTDPNGDTLWTKTYGGSEWDQAWSVQQTSDGGYIVVGFTASFGAGNYDVWLLKTDADGDTLWTRTYGDTGYEAGYSVQQTPDEGYIIAGYTDTGGIQHVYVIKTDADGDTLWTRTYGELSYSRGFSVKQTSDGSYIIAGSTYIFSEVVSSIEIYLIKTDANGDSLWTRTYGEPVGDDYGASVCETSDGSYIITGCSYYLGLGYEILLLKTDADGDSLWARTYGVGHGNSVCETSDGCYMIAGSKKFSGSRSYDVHLMKTDENGGILWTRTYGRTTGWDEAQSVCETSDGSFIVAGWMEFLDPRDRDIWLLKLEPDVGIEEKEPSQELSLVFEADPNPFTDKTLLDYQLPSSAHVQIVIYDPLGRKVKILVDGRQTAGTHTITWDGKDDAGEPLSAGVYFLRFQSESCAQTAKLVMIR